MKKILLRNKQKRAEGFVDQEEDEDEESHTPRSSNRSHQQLLSDYIQLPSSSHQKSEDAPDYLLSPEAALTAAKDTVELLKQLPNDDPIIPGLEFSYSN